MIEDPSVQGNGKLPYPTRPLMTPAGMVEEYLIPEEKKAEVLELLYPFVGVPGLDEVMFDLHAENTFRVGEFKVTWEQGQNWLVSPYYGEAGGTVIDWAPEDWGDDQ